MNLYVGLREFHDMSFVLHALRPGDLFVDVGANVGAYTILAGGVAGAKVFAVEPVPSTFETLTDNIRMNVLEDRVSVFNLGLASKAGELRFSTQQGPKNRVIHGAESEPEVTVPVDRLDDLMRGTIPTVVKIDVEGYELEVIQGARDVLSQPTVLAVILELNGSGKSYGFEDADIDAQMRRFGFETARYDPFERKLRMTDRRNATDNTLYLRHGNVLLERLKTAPRFDGFGISL